MIPEWIYVPTGLLVIALMVVCPLGQRGNGRYVSRKIQRRLRTGRSGAFLAQTLWIVGCSVMAIGSLVVGALVTVAWIGWLVTVAWLLDDALTGGPDDRRRKRRRAKVRLRMPKPVKLRPVQRVPMPA